MQITDEMIDAFGMAFWPVNAATKIDEQQEEIRAALAAALSSAHPAPAQEVEVKPLKWRAYGNQHVRGWQGMGAMGYLHYIVDSGPNGESESGWFSQLGQFDTEEEAKAAAQQDYESRIRSAIVSPASTPDVDLNELSRKLRSGVCVKDLDDGSLGWEYDAEETSKIMGDAAVLIESLERRARAASTPATDKLALAREALRLAEGRLALLMRAYPDRNEEFDHPTATGYVLSKVCAALSTIEESDHG